MAKGSIEKRGENTWRLTIDLGEFPDGSRNRKRKTIRIDDKALLKTKKRLQDHLDEELAKFKIEVEADEYIAPQKMTFEAFVEEWRIKYASKQLAFRTLITYESNLKTRILPTFRHMKVDEIKTLHIVDFLEKLSHDGGRGDKKTGSLSSGSIEMAHRILKNIFTRAVKWKVIKNNPLAGVDKPKVKYKEFIPYNEQEISQMLQALQKEPFHWRIMITLALTTGMRRGELLGLEWKHIDWKSSTLDVNQTLVHALKGEIIVKDPKTKKSKRKISLPASVLDELREYQAYQVNVRSTVKENKSSQWNFVFCHPDGSPFHHERPYLWFRSFLKKNNLRYIRFHDLRHTSATLLINQGVHAKIISERLGHGDIGTTMNVYGHALRSADQHAADKFESVLQFKKNSQSPAPNSSPSTLSSHSEPL